MTFDASQTTAACQPDAGQRRFGMIGGLGPLASVDVMFKLVQACAARGIAEPLDLVFEQHPFRSAGHTSEATTARKLYVFDLLREFEQRGIDTVVLPCFLSHTFIDELSANTPLQIVDMVAAQRAHLRSRYPDVRKIGVLASDYTRQHGLFERYFLAPEFEVLHPRLDRQLDLVTRAVYGPAGLKQGGAPAQALQLLRAACDDLIAQGAQIILPGLTEIALIATDLGRFSVPLLDSNQVYAEYIAAGQYGAPHKSFKVGVVGGVGPAATVDFMRKIVLNTPARRDQDHIKLMIEHNPQIPDRTDNLVGLGQDPTLSLYATCKKLESGAADIIAIPCNTAHAYVERIQPYLEIPIVNMLSVTAEHLRSAFPALRQVGVLATTGTLASGVYEQELIRHGLQQIAPSAALQARVMHAIYGPQGVKAGFTDGVCVTDIHAALEELAERGITVVILGCTELPLLLPQAKLRSISGIEMTLIDPTDILARRCVAFATAARAESA